MLSQAEFRSCVKNSIKQRFFDLTFFALIITIMNRYAQTFKNRTHPGCRRSRGAAGSVSLGIQNRDRITARYAGGNRIVGFKGKGTGIPGRVSRSPYSGRERTRPFLCPGIRHSPRQTLADGLEKEDSSGKAFGSIRTQDSENGQSDADTGLETVHSRYTTPSILRIKTNLPGVCRRHKCLYQNESKKTSRGVSTA